MSSEKITAAELRALIDKRPRAKLGYFPTPLDECPRLSETLGVKILIKREDCTGLAFGGNKVRQLEFTIGDALASGADTIIHGASAQSNHCRQAAAAAAKLGLKCYLRLSRDSKSDEIQGNLLLDHIAGAQVELCDVEFGPELERRKKELAEELKAQGLKPYVIAPPRSTTLGAVAYTDCIAEICQQLEVKFTGVRPDFLYASSAGGTNGGLLLGNKTLQTSFKVVAIAPIGWMDRVERIAAAANSAAQLIGIKTQIEKSEVINYDDYIGVGYGKITSECVEAIKLVAQTEGIFLDPVYTGKAMAGLLDHIKKGQIKPGQCVIFLHTGGTPALFAYNRELVNQSL